MTNEQRDEGGVAPSPPTLRELSELKWSDLTDSTRQHVIQVFLSGRFKSLRALCQYYRLSYQCVYQALQRRGVLEQRRALEESEHFDRMVEAEQSLKTGISDINSQLRSKLAVLDLADAQVLRSLHTGELSLPDLIKITQRYSTDIVRLAAAMNSTAVARSLAEAEITGVESVEASRQQRVTPLGNEQVETIRHVALNLARRNLNPHSMDVRDPARIPDVGANNE